MGQRKKNLPRSNSFREVRALARKSGGVFLQQTCGGGSCWWLRRAFCGRVATRVLDLGVWCRASRARCGTAGRSPLWHTHEPGGGWAGFRKSRWLFGSGGSRGAHSVLGFSFDADRPPGSFPSAERDRWPAPAGVCSTARRPPRLPREGKKRCKMRRASARRTSQKTPNFRNIPEKWPK